MPVNRPIGDVGHRRINRPINCETFANPGEIMVKPHCNRGVKKPDRTIRQGYGTGRASPAFPDVASLFHRATVSEIETAFSQPLRRWAESTLGVRLPESYAALLKQRNGGRLRLNAFPTRRRPKGSSLAVYTFDRIAGVDRDHDESITALTELARREWAVPEGLFPIDGDGHWWLCFDYRRCGPAGEPSITHYDTEGDGGSSGCHVANSFQELVAGLVFHSGDYVFAIDDPELSGASLDRQLAALGCKGEYSKRTNKALRAETPTRWKWPQYRGDSSRSALLDVRDNGATDPWTMARPPDHRLLVLDVGRGDQQRCVRQLVRSFGNSLPLIHEPADRRPIRGLPKYPPFEPPTRPRRPRTNVPAEPHPTALNGAVLHNDFPLVRALLKKGVRPDKPCVPKGATALQIAAAYGQTAMLKLLLAHAQQRPTAKLLSAAIKNGHLGVTKLLVDQGLQPNQADLTWAATYRHEQVVRYLLALGIAPSPQAVRRAAGFVEPILADAPRGLHRPILRMLKQAGAVAPNAEIQKLFDTM